VNGPSQTQFLDGNQPAAPTNLTIQSSRASPVQCNTEAHCTEPPKIIQKMITLILLQDMTNISVEGEEIPNIEKLRNVNN
jgi:hypothetical protein